MKSAILRLGFLALFAFSAIGCSAGKIAVVNPELANRNSTSSEKGAAYLRSVGTELESELRALEEKVNSAQTKQQKAEAQAEMQTRVVAIQQRFNAEQQQVLNAISEVYKKALDTCREKLGLDLVLPNEVALSHNPAMDITKNVTEEMNALPLEFKPIQAEPAAVQ